jgi:hypothetical protein
MLSTSPVILLSTAVSSTAAGWWPDSSDGVHTFLTFDTGVPIANITAPTMKQYDFVWGACVTLFIFLSSVNVWALWFIARS